MALHSKTPECHLFLRSEPSATRELRAAVERLGCELGLSEEDRFDLKLAATEALTNAFRARGDELEDAVEVTIAPRGGSLGIEIHDPALGTVAWPLGRADLDAEGGRGVPLMLALVDEVELAAAADGTRVRIRKRFGRRGAESGLF